MVETDADIIRRRMADPVIMADMVANVQRQHEEKRAARAAFMASPTFAGMIQTIVESPDPIGFDSQEIAYFPDQALQRVWQGRYTKADAERLLDILGHPTEEEVPEASKTRDPNSQFLRLMYTVHGVKVHIFSGQGTIVTVYNREIGDESEAEAPR